MAAAVHNSIRSADAECSTSLATTVPPPPTFTNIDTVHRRLKRKHGKKPTLNRFSRDSSTISKTNPRTHTTYQAHRNGSLSWATLSIPSLAIPNTEATIQNSQQSDESEGIFDPLDPGPVDNLLDEVDLSIYDMELAPSRRRTESVCTT